MSWDNNEGANGGGWDTGAVAEEQPQDNGGWDTGAAANADQPADGGWGGPVTDGAE